MVSAEIVDYIKEQLAAGYPPEEIEMALRSQGWSDQEIRDGFSLNAPTTTSDVPEVNFKQPRGKSYIISLVGGILLFIVGLETFLTYPLISGYLPVFSLLGYFETFIATFGLLATSLLILAFAIITIAGSLFAHKSRAGGILAIIGGLAAVVGFHGLLILAGGILAIIGGALSLKK